jgi:hypothetical protein
MVWPVYRRGWGPTSGPHVHDMVPWSHLWHYGPTRRSHRSDVAHGPTGGSSSPDMGPTPLTWRLRPTGVVLLAGPTSLTWPCGAEAAARALRFLFGKKTCSLGASNRRLAAAGRGRLPLDHSVGCVVVYFFVLFV